MDDRVRSLERTLIVEPSDEAALRRLCAERRRRGDEWLPDRVRVDTWQFIFEGVEVVRRWVASGIGHVRILKDRDGSLNVVRVLTERERRDFEAFWRAI